MGKPRVETQLQPRAEFIVCRLIAGPKLTASGLHVPESAKSMENVGRVRIYAVGPKVEGVTVGQVYILGDAKAFQVIEDGVQFIILHASNLLALDAGYEEPENEIHPRVTIQ